MAEPFLSDALELVPGVEVNGWLSRILRKSVRTIVDMLYTWDEEKRKANRAKHGVDLADAALIFEGSPA